MDRTGEKKKKSLIQTSEALKRWTVGCSAHSISRSEESTTWMKSWVTISIRETTESPLVSFQRVLQFQISRSTSTLIKQRNYLAKPATPSRIKKKKLYIKKTYIILIYPDTCKTRKFIHQSSSYSTLVFIRVDLFLPL